MSDVTRWDCHYADIVSYADGGFVKYDVYVALLADLIRCREWECDRPLRDLR
jgi:hypothetical protein